MTDHWYPGGGWQGFGATPSHSLSGSQLSSWGSNWTPGFRLGMEVDSRGQRFRFSGETRQMGGVAWQTATGHSKRIFRQCKDGASDSNEITSGDVTEDGHRSGKVPRSGNAGGNSTERDFSGPLQSSVRSGTGFGQSASLFEFEERKPLLWDSALSSRETTTLRFDDETGRHSRDNRLLHSVRLSSLATQRPQLLRVSVERSLLPLQDNAVRGFQRTVHFSQASSTTGEVSSKSGDTVCSIPRRSGIDGAFDGGISRTGTVYSWASRGTGFCGEFGEIDGTDATVARMCVSGNNTQLSLNDNVDSSEEDHSFETSVPDDTIEGSRGSIDKTSVGIRTGKNRLNVACSSDSSGSVSSTGGGVSTLESVEIGLGHFPQTTSKECSERASLVLGHGLGMEREIDSPDDSSRPRSDVRCIRDSWGSFSDQPKFGSSDFGSTLSMGDTRIPASVLESTGTSGDSLVTAAVERSNCGSESAGSDRQCSLDVCCEQGRKSSAGPEHNNSPIDGVLSEESHNSDGRVCSGVGEPGSGFSFTISESGEQSGSGIGLQRERRGLRSNSGRGWPDVDRHVRNGVHSKATQPSFVTLFGHSGSSGLSGDRLGSIARTAVSAPPNSFVDASSDKGNTTSGRVSVGGAVVAGSVVVVQPGTTRNGHLHGETGGGRVFPMVSSSVGGDEDWSDSVEVIRTGLREKGLDVKSIEQIIQSRKLLSNSDKRQADWRQWHSFAILNGFSVRQPEDVQLAAFLTVQLERVGKSGLITWKTMSDRLHSVLEVLRLVHPDNFSDAKLSITFQLLHSAKRTNPRAAVNSEPSLDGSVLVQHLLSKPLPATLADSRKHLTVVAMLSLGCRLADLVNLNMDSISEGPGQNGTVIVRLAPGKGEKISATKKGCVPKPPPTLTLTDMDKVDERLHILHAVRRYLGFQQRLGHRKPGAIREVDCNALFLSLNRQQGVFTSVTSDTLSRDVQSMLQETGVELASNKLRSVTLNFQIQEGGLTFSGAVALGRWQQSGTMLRHYLNSNKHNNSACSAAMQKVTSASAALSNCESSSSLDAINTGVVVLSEKELEGAASDSEAATLFFERKTTNTSDDLKQFIDKSFGI